MDTIEIQTNKSKLLLILAINLLFVVLGIWILFSPEVRIPVIESRSLAIVAGILCILFFGFLSRLTFKKIQNNKPGIIINEHGITDHYSALSTIEIPWKDIEKIKTAKANNQKYVLVLVKSPKKYIESAKSNFEKKARKANFDKFGTPICISTSTLKIEFNELYNILIDRLNLKRA